MRACMLAMAIALGPAVADAQPRLRPTALELRHMALRDQQVTMDAVRRPAMFLLTGEARPVTGPGLTVAMPGMRRSGFRVAPSVDHLSPLMRALHEVNAANARRPKPLSFRPIVLLTIDIEDAGAMPRFGGAAFRLLGMESGLPENALAWHAWEGVGRVWQ